MDDLMRLAPRPKHIELSGYHAVSPSDLAIVRAGGDAWTERAAAELAAHLASRGGTAVPVATGPVPGRKIVVRLLPPGPAARGTFAGRFFDPARVAGAFHAYRLRGLGRAGLVLQGLAPEGAYWGMKTVKQLLRFEGRRVLLPIVRILDGADLEDRGMWIPPFGGPTSPYADRGRTLAHYRRWLDWMSDHKLNLVEVMTLGWAGVNFATRRYPEFQAPDAATRGDLLKTLGRYGASRGVRVVPVFTHPEHFRFIAAKFPELRPAYAVRHHGQEVRLGVDFFKPRTAAILGDLAEELVEAVDPPDLCFWLAENRLHARPPARQTRSEFTQEAQTYYGIAERLRRARPALGLRLLLSQGSYPENVTLMRAFPMTVKWIYYSGERFGTYTIRPRNPIPPEMAAAARAGHWISLCNAITGVPGRPTVWSGLHAGLGHAIAAGFRGVDGMAFTGAGDQLSLFVTAEHAWNHAGRPLRETLAAYAAERGARDPERQAAAYTFYDEANFAQGVRDSIGVGQPFGDFSRYFNMLERIKGNDKVDELIMHLVDGMEDDELPALAAAEARLVEALALADPADPLFRRRAHYLLHVVRHSRAVARAFYVVGREKSRDLYKGDWADYRDELRRCLAQIAPETRRAGPWFRQATRLEQWGSVRQTTKDPLANAAAFAAGIDVRRVTSPTER